MRSVRLIITGRVQGVGYRAWVEQNARQRGLTGWVRNRRDGSVEALLSGDDATVAAMIAACQDGPPAARVTSIEPVEVARPEDGGFRVLPTE